MGERIGPRSPYEIEREPPKEAPYIQPTDQPGDAPLSSVRDDIDDGLDEGSDIEPLPRMEPMGPGDKEAKFWNTEADAIEAWADEVGDPEAYVRDVEARMYEPSDTGTDIGQDIGDVSEDIGDFDPGVDIDGSDQEP